MWPAVAMACGHDTSRESSTIPSSWALERHICFDFESKGLAYISTSSVLCWNYIFVCLFELLKSASMLS